MAEKVAPSDRKRNTKNSLKVAAFENQNKILKQVLEASKELDTAAMKKSGEDTALINKDGASGSKGEGQEENPEVSNGTEKSFSSEFTQTYAEDRAEDYRYKDNAMDSFHRGKQILAYPDYDNWDRSGTGSYRFDEPGSHDLGNGVMTWAGNMEPQRRVTKTTRPLSSIPAAAGCSSNKMDAPLLFSEIRFRIIRRMS